MTATYHPQGERSFTDLFEALFCHSLDAILLTRTDGTILRANPAACQVLGRTEEEIRALGRHGLVVDTPELERAVRERAERGSVRAELSFRRANGEIFPGELTSTVIPLSVGVPVTLITFRDVTERRRRDGELRDSLQALRDSEERFRVAFDTLPDAITITEQETGRFLEVSEGTERVSGWTRAEMIGRTVDELGLWHDDDRGDFVRRLQSEGHVRDWPARLRRKDGTVLEVRIWSRGTMVAGQNLLLTITRDVTAERDAARARANLEQQLRQSQKMEAIGRLAGGVAHDFNNLLTVIFSCGEALEDDLRRGLPPNLDDLKEIRIAAERASDLTRQLLALARRQLIDPEPLDLNEVIRGSEKLLRRVIGEDVELLVTLQPSLRAVRCDRALLEQVILNLAVNARDALPDGGHLRIETSDVDLSDVGASQYVGVAPGAYVRVCVIDDGVGMAPEVRERIFEPFFTTKEKGQGTGLGLSVVHGIVAQSGGHIRVESEPGRGTRLEFLLPAIPEAASLTMTAEVEAALSGSETILLVEDEEMVREATARTLRKTGYRVLAAASGAEALQLAASEPKVDLLLCDVMMPGQNGREVHEALSKERPSVKTLFVSGYPHEVIQERVVLAPGIELLPKPFTTAALLSRIRLAIDAPST